MNNNNYYPNYQMPSGYPNQEYAQTAYTLTNNEQSYVENVLRMNKGKLGKFYFTFPDSNEYRDVVFSGIVESAARDHLIISNPSTGKWYLLQMVYLDYCEFDEKLNYINNF